MGLKSDTLEYIKHRIEEQLARLEQVVKFAQAPTKTNTVALISHEINF